MIGEPIGLYDVGTGASLNIEHTVDLGCAADGTPMKLDYTTASHGRLVVIRSGCLSVTYDIAGAMIDEDADRIGRWLDMDGERAVQTIRENAKR